MLYEVITQDVPVYLRTGKRMAASVSEISIRFRPVPHRALPNSVADSARPVSLILHLQPDEGIRWRIYVKEPGTHLRLRTVNMDFSYRQTFRIPTPVITSYSIHYTKLYDGPAPTPISSARWRWRKP